jgi:hypothetical protein
VAKVTAGATGMMQTIGMLMAMAGDAQCSEAVMAGAANWGKAMGELSRYQPGLVKVFAPTGEATGQAFAWVGVFAATVGVMTPVLVHHGAIKPELALKITGGITAASTTAETMANASGTE